MMRFARIYLCYREREPIERFAIVWRRGSLPIASGGRSHEPALSGRRYSGAVAPSQAYWRGAIALSWIENQRPGWL
jgi:hypothetical protein